ILLLAGKSLDNGIEDRNQTCVDERENYKREERSGFQFVDVKTEIRRDEREPCDDCRESNGEQTCTKAAEQHGDDDGGIKGEKREPRMRNGLIASRASAAMPTTRTATL